MRCQSNCLVYTMTQCFELLDSPPGLFVRVVSGANSPHTCWFVAGVTLGAVVEIRVGATRAISKNSGHLGIRNVDNGERATHTQILPVIAMCGHR